jgi:guanosine-3',5'-bis(diphosphate) 3'-pyrophosphohydrolase
MIRFEDLAEKVRSYSPDADFELLRRAYVFSAFEHKGQVRHSGEPYMVHPLEVASFLADLKLDVVAIAAGLLHDVVEDTLTSIERIEELFGRDARGRRGDENQRHPLFLERRAPGRELPQDAPRHGG